MFECTLGYSCYVVKGARNELYKKIVKSRIDSLNNYIFRLLLCICKKKIQKKQIWTPTPKLKIKIKIRFT